MNGNIIQGILAVVSSPMNLLVIFFGVFVGIIFGSIPGLSAVMAVCLFLPISFSAVDFRYWTPARRPITRATTAAITPMRTFVSIASGHTSFGWIVRIKGGRSRCRTRRRKRTGPETALAGLQPAGPHIYTKLYCTAQIPLCQGEFYNRVKVFGMKGGAAVSPCRTPAVRGRHRMGKP